MCLLSHLLYLSTKNYAGSFYSVLACTRISLYLFIPTLCSYTCVAIYKFLMPLMASIMSRANTKVHIGQCHVF